MSQITLSVLLSEKEYKKFLYFKDIIELERELHPTDFDCLAMMITQMSIYEDARKSIQNDGAIIYSTSKYGQQIPKANPSNEVASKANTAIKGYLEQLLLTPKAKAAINKAMSEKPEEEEDPLTIALKQRASRKLN
ncbi:P27 family phage terminase small subunit [Vibrio parahaemolyticus]|uniref:P27 family phage terminase small subunit n=1 Tax=Vibrio parahaemolyticus TaxID=670 RepID=UPI0005F24B66|nr:P27 family phage terminase small subunit [Vibrio parahaemolyticus]KJR15246.1 hypothetical protein UF28_16405 [Vibrio parahaemolyticus]